MTNKKTIDKIKPNFIFRTFYPFALHFMSIGKPGNLTTLIGAAALSLATPGTAHGVSDGAHDYPTKTHDHPTSEEPSHSPPPPPPPEYFIEKGPQDPQREDYPKPKNHHQPLVAVLTQDTGRRMNQIIEKNTRNGPIPTRPPQTTRYPGSSRSTGRRHIF